MKKSWEPFRINQLTSRLQSQFDYVLQFFSFISDILGLREPRGGALKVPEMAGRVGLDFIRPQFF